MSTAAQLDLIIRAQDQASRTISGVSRNLSGLNSVTQAFGLGSVFAYGAATAALGSFVAMGVNELAEAQKVQAQTNAVLKSTGEVAGVTAGHVEALSSRLSNLAAVDDEVIQGGANVLLTFTNIRNSGVDKTFDRAMQAALDLSRAFGQDLQSSVVQIGKALQDPISGVTALRRVGIQLTQAQEDQIKQFVALNDVASAQKVILAELERQVGGSAEAYGDTFAGSVAKAKLRLEEFSAEIIGNTIVGLGMIVDKLGDIKDAVDVFGLLERGSDDATKAAETEAQVWEWVNRELGTAKQKAHSVQAELVYINGQLAQFGPVAPTPFGPSIEDAELLARKADEARRAIFDALNIPSQERSQRELGLAQAQFNVARLEQQGAKDGLLSPERQQWYQWLVETFIPAQEDWLKTDELRVDRDEKAAVLTQMLTGEYRDMNAVIDGQLGPNIRNLNEGVYDTQDAMQGLKQVSPINIKTSFKDPKPPSVKTLNDIIKAADPTEEIKVGMRPNPPALSGMNAIIRNADPTETIKVGMEAKKRISGIPAVIAASDPTETVKVGMEARKTITGVVATILATDPTETIKVGMQAKPTISGMSEVIKNADPTEEVKVGMRAYALDSESAVRAVIANIQSWWQKFTNPFGGATPGVGIRATESQAAAVLRPQIIAIPRPDNRGMTPGGGGDLHVHFHGQADLSTPTGRQYVVNALWGEFNAKLRTG